MSLIVFLLFISCVIFRIDDVFFVVLCVLVSVVVLFVTLIMICCCLLWLRMSYDYHDNRMCLLHVLRCVFTCVAIVSFINVRSYAQNDHYCGYSSSSALF